MKIFKNLASFSRLFPKDKHFQRAQAAIKLSQPDPSVASPNAVSPNPTSPSPTDPNMTGSSLLPAVTYSVGDSLTYVILEKHPTEYRSWQSTRHYYTIVQAQHGNLELRQAKAEAAAAFQITRSYSNLEDRQYYCLSPEAAADLPAYQSQILAPGEIALFNPREIFQIRSCGKGKDTAPFRAVFLRVSAASTCQFGTEMV